MRHTLDITAPGEAGDILRSLIVAVQLGFLIYKYVHEHTHRRRPRKHTKAEHPKQQEVKTWRST